MTTIDEAKQAARDYVQSAFDTGVWDEQTYHWINQFEFIEIYDEKRYLMIEFCDKNEYRTKIFDGRETLMYQWLREVPKND